MTTRRRQQLLYGQLAWMLSVLLVLTLLEQLTLELFFVCSLIGFLVTLELTAPVNVTPAWRARLRWLLGLGVLTFVAIVIRRVLLILPPEVIP